MIKHPIYNTTIKVHPSITTEVIVEACMRRETDMDNPGFCMACGEESDCCEPDASWYKCESCGQEMVMAPEELLLRGI